MDGARIFAGDGAEWLKEPPSMIEELKKQLVELATKGYEPGAIIMTPSQMKRFLNEMSRTPNSSLQADPKQGSSGWTFEGVPMYRSWEIVGPCVVSRAVFTTLRFIDQLGWSPDLSDGSNMRERHNLLF